MKLTINCLIVALLVLFAAQNSNQEKDQKQTETAEPAKIQQLLTDQTKLWNEKDIEGFMQTYWKSKDLTFSSGGSTTRGWQATLDRYKSKYPPEKMGELRFDNLEVSVLSNDVALVLGTWHLKMKETAPEGNFSLVLKKLSGEWKIVHDHSSLKEK